MSATPNTTPSPQANAAIRDAATRDQSAHYLFLIAGTPLIALLIASSAMFEARGLPIPLVRIGTGAAGLLLQTIPFTLFGAMMAAAVRVWANESFIERHAPRSLASGLGMALVTGLCLPVCDCMVVPTFANLVRKRLPLPCAVTFLCAVPVMNPVAIWATWFAFSARTWGAAARVMLGMLAALSTGSSFACWPPKDAPMRERSWTFRGHRGEDAGDPRDASPCDCAHGLSCGCAPQAAEPGRPDQSGRGGALHTLTRYLRYTHHDFMRLMPIMLFGSFTAAIVRMAMPSATASAGSAAGSGQGSLLGDVASASGFGAAALAAVIAIAAAMGLAFLCSMCSSSDAVIAAGLSSAFPMTAILAFLVFGPMLDLKNTLMLAGECRPRFAVRLAATIAVSCAAVMLAASPLILWMGA